MIITKSFSDVCTIISNTSENIITLAPIHYQTFCDKGYKLNVKTKVWVSVNFSGRLFQMDSKWPKNWPEYNMNSHYYTS